MTRPGVGDPVAYASYMAVVAERDALLKEIVVLREFAQTADFDKLLHDIEAEARAEGPAALRELHEFDFRFRLAVQAARRARERTSGTNSERINMGRAGQADLEGSPLCSSLASSIGFAISMLDEALEALNPKKTVDVATARERIFAARGELAARLFLARELAE